MVSILDLGYRHLFWIRSFFILWRITLVFFFACINSWLFTCIVIFLVNCLITTIYWRPFVSLLRSRVIHIGEWMLLLLWSRWKTDGEIVDHILQIFHVVHCFFRAGLMSWMPIGRWARLRQTNFRLGHAEHKITTPKAVIAVLKLLSLDIVHEAAASVTKILSSASTSTLHWWAINLLQTLAEGVEHIRRQNCGFWSGGMVRGSSRHLQLMNLLLNWLLIYFEF